MNEQYHNDVINDYRKFVALQNALRIKRKIEQLRKEDIPFYETRRYA